MTSLRAHDNPSEETQIALVILALNNFMDTTNKTLSRIEQQVVKTNGSVADVTERMNEHDIHHGPRDSNIADRLKGHDDDIEKLAKDTAELVVVQHDATIVKAEHANQWKLLAGATAFGASLATVGGIIVQLVLKFS